MLGGAVIRSVGYIKLGRRGKKSLSAGVCEVTYMCMGVLERGSVKDGR